MGISQSPIGGLDGFFKLIGLLFWAFGTINAIPAWAAGTGGTWLLRGTVLPSEQAESGHYEVGFYSAVGPSGLPAGFPVVQEILPAGRSRFRLHIPLRLERGYVFAELVEDGGGRKWIVPTENPWTPSTPQPAELYLRVGFDGPSRTLVAPTASDLQVIQGAVATMFSPADAPIAQEGVTVKVRGRKETTTTDAHGNFSLAMPRFRGRVWLEFTKDSYHPSIVAVDAGDPRAVRVELASLSAMEQIAERLGVTQGSTFGAVIGRALDESGAPLAGLGVQLSRQAAGPFYFDDRGVPTRELRTTSTDGRFLFLDVPPGPAFLEAEIAGEQVVPTRVSLAEGGELLQKNLAPVSGTLSGRIYQPVRQGGPVPLAGARVRIEGFTEWTTSDSTGAFRLGPFRWSRGEKISVAFSAENFQNHRYQLEPGPLEHKLYAFPATYLAHLAESREVSLDPEAGLVIGRSVGPSVRVDGLTDAMGPNPVQDFYFDAHGRMRSSPAMTDPRFGTYMLFNVPSGHAYLLGSDLDGSLRFGRDIFAGPSVVNVEVDGD